MKEIKGVLIPVGGNEDKGHVDEEGRPLDFITEGILSRIVRESGGVNACIKIIPTASSIPDEVGEMYLEAFGKLGCTDLEVLDIREVADANKPETLESLRQADCIMMSGGDQSRIAEIIGGTASHDIMKERYVNERIVIAGTSAGAMAMSNEMISGGRATEALWKGAVDMRQGLGLVPSLIIDSHFIMRGRFGRLAEATATHPSLVGVGLAEDTGIIITNGNRLKVIGSGMVIVFDPGTLKHNNRAILPEGEPLTLANMTVHVLANGDAFDLSEKTVSVLPMGAPLEV